MMEFDSANYLIELNKEKDRRIKELEAELERLKSFCNEWIYNEENFQKGTTVEVCPVTTEEGER